MYGNFIKGSFLSSDGENRAAYYIYEPKEPKAVIQLSHGMCEYVERYEPHAKYFCSCGFVFAGHDHLGHKGSVKSDADLGYTVAADVLTADLARMTDILKEKYSGLPVILLGHSMGSFILRDYMQKYKGKIKAAVISGTAGPDNPTALGKLLASLICKIKGDHHRSHLLYSMSTGSYSKPFGKGAHKNCWLTRDEKEVERYTADKFSNFIFTANGYKNLFELLSRVSKRSWAESIDKELPILLISGTDDPVGSFGKGVRKVYERIRAANVKDVTLCLLDGARHEPFNEIEPTKSEAYKTVTDWINERI